MQLCLVFVKVALCT